MLALPHAFKNPAQAKFSFEFGVVSLCTHAISMTVYDCVGTNGGKCIYLKQITNP